MNGLMLFVGLVLIIGIILFVLLAVAALFWTLFRFFVASRRTIYVNPEMIDWEAIRHDSVASLLPAKKSWAIVAYKTLTNASIEDATAAIGYVLKYPEQAEAKKARHAEHSLSTSGLRDLIAEGRLEEAAELYRQFAGVDEYTAREAVEGIQRGMAQ